jgi:hypothetical protein
MVRLSRLPPGGHEVFRPTGGSCVSSVRLAKGFRSPSGSESLSLACPRESNQREGHPRTPRSAGLWPADCASRLRGSPTAPPCAGVELARIPAGHPSGCSSTCSPGRTGESQQQEHGSARLFAFAFPPYGAAASGRKARRGGARDRAASAAGTGMCRQRNPAAGREPAGLRPAGAPSGGALSLGYFSLGKQREVTRTPKAGESFTCNCDSRHTRHPRATAINLIAAPAAPTATPPCSP